LALLSKLSQRDVEHVWDTGSAPGTGKLVLKLASEDRKDYRHNAYVYVARMCRMHLEVFRGDTHLGIEEYMRGRDTCTREDYDTIVQLLQEATHGSH